MTLVCRKTSWKLAVYNGHNLVCLLCSCSSLQAFAFLKLEARCQGPGIDGKPWLGVLGNHDWGGWQFNKGWVGNSVAASDIEHFYRQIYKSIQTFQHFSRRINFNSIYKCARSVSCGSTAHRLSILPTKLARETTYKTSLKPQIFENQRFVASICASQDQVIAYSWGGLPESTGRWLQPAIYWAAPVRLEAQSLRDILVRGQSQVETMDSNIPQTSTNQDARRQPKAMLSNNIHTLSHIAIAMKFSKIA